MNTAHDEPNPWITPHVPGTLRTRSAEPAANRKVPQPDPKPRQDDRT